MRPAHGLILAIVGLLVLGTLMVQSAGFSVGRAETLTLSGILTGKTSLLALGAVALMTIGAFVPLEVLRRPGVVALLVLSTITLLVLVWLPGIGAERNGAWRWIRIGPVGFQPSEIAKWTMPIALAWWIASRPDRMRRLLDGFVLPLGAVAAICLLIAVEDLGTAVVIGLVAMIVLVAGGTRPVAVAAAVPLAVGAFFVLALTSEYRTARLKTFLDPLADPGGMGYHVVQSLAAISGGGVGGRGLGGGVQKFGYLPEDTTDFIFSVICEELGLFGAGLTVALYATLIGSGLLILRRVRDPFAGLLGLGILATVALQALINLMVVTALAPTKGIALPLVSSGGTGWCLTAGSLGLLLSMQRNNALASTGVIHERALPATPVALRG